MRKIAVLKIFNRGTVYMEKNCSHFVTGSFSFFHPLTMFVIPFIVGALTPDNTQDQWRIVFFIIAAIEVISSIIFNLKLLEIY